MRGRKEGGEAGGGWGQIMQPPGKIYLEGNGEPLEGFLAEDERDQIFCLFGTIFWLLHGD